jgi:hypothetical protein
VHEEVWAEAFGMNEALARGNNGIKEFEDKLSSYANYSMTQCLLPSTTSPIAII